MIKFSMAVLIILLFVISGFVADINAEQIKTEKGLFLIEVNIDKEVLRVGEIRSIKLIVRDAYGNGVDGADIKATPWMTEHGHGSSKQTEVMGKGGGIYIVENLYFTMKGKWDLIIEIKHKGKDDSALIPLPKVKL